jgi:HK97 gp10 family phage protein
MASPVMKFTGGPELVAALRQLPASVGKAVVTKAMKDVVEPMVVDMQAAAPKLTGRGAESIHSAVVSVEGFGATVAVGPDRAHFYLAFSEWGTAKMPARPFMRPAWDSHQREILEGFGTAMWEKLAAAARRLAGKAGA